ncbi:Uncharacterized protein FWK35_00025383, partial [Aphis craccivora]
MDENRDLKLKISNIEVRILCLKNNKTQTQHSSFEHDVIEELMNRQVRSNNVILFNLPENENDNDLENIKYIFTNLNENIGDFKFSRLGRTKSTIHDRPRPIKIRLTEQSDVFSILRAQKILKNSTKWSNIHFSSDKTTKQRNEMSNLRNTSLNNKLSYLKSQLPCALHDIFIFTETWLTNNVMSSELGFHNYYIYRYDRTTQTSMLSRGGGVLIAVRNNLQSKLIVIENNSIELLFVLLNISNLTIIIGSVYIPNKSNEN